MINFDSDFVRSLEYLYLVSHRAFNGQLLARHKSDRKTGGVEFSEHREYSEGDDLRYLDWNVFARNDNLLIKRFQEEEDLHVHILLDISTSMDTGFPNKLDWAKQVAAALAYIALAEDDCVGITTFDSKLRDTIPVTRGKQHILQFLRFLETRTPGTETTDLLNTFQEWLARRPHRGLVILISDFFDPAGWQEALEFLRARRFEPMMITVYDEHDAHPDFRGDRILVDVETGEQRLVTIDESALAHYQVAFQRFLNGITDWCRRFGYTGTTTTTQVPYNIFLRNLMEQQ